MKANRVRPSVFMFLILVHACGSSIGGPPAAESALPETSVVLYSTDLLDLSDLHLENIDADQLPGRYSSEQGGSVLFLTVTPQKGDRADTWVVERVYTEPATENISRRYVVHKTEFGLASKTGDLIVRQTREGLIAFEKDSGLDTIPADYWIYYRKQD